MARTAQAVASKATTAPPSARSQAARTQSGIELRAAERLAGEDERGLTVLALLDEYRMSGCGMSVGVACAFGVQLCDALHALHRESPLAGESPAHAGVSLDNVWITREGKLSLGERTHARGTTASVGSAARDVRDAAVLVSELLGGESVALKLVPVELARVLQRAIGAEQAGERPVRAAELARALACEAADDAEVALELRLPWPSLAARESGCFDVVPTTRMPPPPRVPRDFGAMPLPTLVSEHEPAKPWRTSHTIAARPPSVRRCSGRVGARTAR